MFLTCSSVIATTMVVGLPSQLLSTSSNWISGVNSLAIILNSSTLSSPIRKVTGKSSEMSSTNTFFPVFLFLNESISISSSFPWNSQLLLVRNSRTLEQITAILNTFSTSKTSTSSDRFSVYFLAK